MNETKRTWKRLGVWERVERTTQVDGHTVPYTAVVVTHKGHRWERPDTREGRAEISVAIRTVEDRELRRVRIERLRAKVAELAKEMPGEVDVEAGGAVAKAADLLRTAGELMDAEDAREQRTA
jgi:hypothetical protein